MAFSATTHPLAKLFTAASELHSTTTKSARAHSSATGTAFTKTFWSAGHRLSTLGRLAQTLGADITVEIVAVQVGYVLGRLKPRFPRDAIHGELAHPEVP